MRGREVTFFNARHSGLLGMGRDRSVVRRRILGCSGIDAAWLAVMKQEGPQLKPERKQPRRDLRGNRKIRLLISDGLRHRDGQTWIKKGRTDGVGEAVANEGRDVKGWRKNLIL